MIPSRIAYDLALMQHMRLLTRVKLSASDAKELTDSLANVVNTAMHIVRAEIEAERDEARRIFYAQNPKLADHRPIVANLSRLEANTPDAAHLEQKKNEVDPSRALGGVGTVS